jgi:hypothetical protein
MSLCAFLEKDFCLSTHVLIIMDLVITSWMTSFISSIKIDNEIVGIVFQHNVSYLLLQNKFVNVISTENESHHHFYDYYSVLMSIVLVTIMIQ